MTKPEAPREWMVDPIELDAFPLNNFKFLGNREWQLTCVHVIEKGAFDTLKAKLAEAEKQLEKYRSGDHKRVGFFDEQYGD